MTQWVFEPEPTTALVVAQSEALFPVRRVYCVGRNYAEHAQEMGHSGREAPFFFTKPANSLVQILENREGIIQYSPRTNDLHHEIELVVALVIGVSNLTVVLATVEYWGYTIGVDLHRHYIMAEERGKRC